MTPHLDDLPALLQGDTVPLLDALTVHRPPLLEDRTEGVETTVTAVDGLVHHLLDARLHQDTVAHTHRDRTVVERREAHHDTLTERRLAREAGARLRADAARARTLRVPVELAEPSSPVKDEPVQVKEEPVDGPMDLDRSALPPLPVKRERSASPVKLERDGSGPNREGSASVDAGPSPDRAPKLPQVHERRAPPTGPRGGRPWEGERSPSRSVKAESPALSSIHRFKQEPSPYHRQNDGSMSPAVTSPHPNHPQIPTHSTRTGKPIPSGPRAGNRAPPAAPPQLSAPIKTEPEKPKVKDIEIPNRRRDWSYLPGHKERELLSQKLLMQQKGLQDVALAVIGSGWDLDVHGVELEGLKEKREFAERMFERASQGLTQDEAVDQNPAAHLKPSRAGSAAPSKAASAATTN